MGLFNNIRQWIGAIFKSKELFGVKSVNSQQMDSFIQKCERIYQGKPDWLDPNNDIKTIGFAKAICSEIARLATLNIGILIEGSARAKYLQKQIDDCYYQLRSWVEYAAAYGAIILKPNGVSIDVVLPADYIVTDVQNGKIRGCVFINRATNESQTKYYTRLEYHRFIEGNYYISNRCFVGNYRDSLDDAVDIKETPWSQLTEDVIVTNTNELLFGLLAMPNANNIDINSPLTMPVFSDAIEELKDLDIAYSLNAKEIAESSRIVLLDSDRMLPNNPNAIRMNADNNASRSKMGLPKYVRILDSTDNAQDMYQEINPNLNTDVRVNGINALLSQIGYKCGFSNGYFVFNQKSGITTATQVEADQQRTIQLIKDVRDKLQSCLDDVINAMNVFADIYQLAPYGTYEVTYSFGDMLYNYEDDKSHWWSYVQSGKMPFWRYLVKFENMTKEDAKQIQAETEVKDKTLFEDE